MIIFDKLNTTKRISFKGTDTVISNDFLCKDANVTLNSLTLNSMSKILMFLILKTDYFHLGVLYKSDIQISTAGIHLEMIRTNYLKTIDR